MENYNDEQISDINIQRVFWARLQIVTRFVKSLIYQFKITQQDLKDAGVYLRRMYD